MLCGVGCSLSASFLIILCRVAVSCFLYLKDGAFF